MIVFTGCDTFSFYLCFSLPFIPIEDSTKNDIKNIVKSYNDPLSQRNIIRKDTNGKIGVYAWVNKINNKVYVGSGEPLYLRLSDYYQNWYIISRSNLYIVRALSKYTMANFSLHIEYTDSNNLIACEQKWIDLLNPEYNTNPYAGNTKGYKHTTESLEMMRQKALGRKHSEVVKKSMSVNRMGENNSFFGKKHSPETLQKLKKFAANRNYSPVPGLEVEITDIETKVTTVYDSVRKAASAINSDIKTLLRREKSQNEIGVNILYRNKYFIKRD